MLPRLEHLEHLRALGQYFGVRDIGRVDAALSKVGLDLVPALEHYRNYIELVLTPEEGATGKVATLIDHTRALVGQLVVQAVDDGGTPNKWLINDRLRDAMGRIAQSGYVALQSVRDELDAHGG